MLKAVDQKDRDNLEAQLMGGEIQADDEPVIEESSKPVEEVRSAEPETQVDEVVETLDNLKARLADVERKREDAERAMREERESKKVSERTLQTLVERLETIKNEKEAQQVAAQRNYEPVYEEDPAAYLKWQNDQILADRRQEREQRQVESKQTDDQRRFQELQQAIKQGFNSYAEVTPDYNEAAQHLIAARVKELEIMGIRDKAEQMRTLQEEELQVGSWALQRGISPGELVYNLAQARGYQKGAQSMSQVALDPGSKPQVKSLSNISGGAPGNKESLQARAERILAATNLKDVLALNQDDLEKILKEAR